MVCVFNTDKEAFALPNKILKAGIDPISIEYMGDSANTACLRKNGSRPSRHSTRISFPGSMPWAAR